MGDIRSSVDRHNAELSASQRELAAAQEALRVTQADLKAQQAKLVDTQAKLADTDNLVKGLYERRKTVAFMLDGKDDRARFVEHAVRRLSVYFLLPEGAIPQSVEVRIR